MKLKLTFLICCCLAAAGLYAQSISGTYLVGSNQPVYKKLTDVAAALNNSANTVTGNVIFELDSDYDGTTGETLPITFNQFNSSGSWTVTIRPKAGVSMRTTSGDPGSNTPVILLNGADSLVFEGRAGGTGTTIGWTIRNKHTGPNPGAAIGLQNDAKKDRLSYLQLEANPTLIDQAVVLLGSTTGPDGNDGNTVSYCNIRNRSDISSPGMYDYPGAGIISVNTTGQESRFNSGNLFEYNNILNFFYPGDSSFGICAYAGTRETTISGNSFYHSAGLYNYPGTFQAAIFIREQSSVSGTVVTNNFIGGSEPRCNGTYVVGYDSYKFAAIQFQSHQPLTGQGINQIDGNTIQSFDFSVDVFPDGEVFAGIKVVNSAANVTNNTIGKLTGTQNISLSCGPQPNVSCKAIDYQGLSGSIVNNKIGAFRVEANTIDFTAISFKEAVAGTTVAITGNVVGGATASDGAVTIYGAAVPQKVRGIAITSEGSVNCTGNAISRITVGRPGGVGTLGTTSLVLNGIMKTGTGASVIKDNTVSELVSYCFSPAEDIKAPGFAGISIQQGWRDTVEHNTITGLKRLRPSIYQGSNSGATCIAGIAVAENVYTQIDNNTIEKFESVNDAHPSTLIGIAGGSRFYNNTISLTNRNEATSTYRENNCSIIGILNNAADMYIFHNSVYVGGNNGSGTNTARSAAVQFSQATSSYVVWNNLFVNERSGGSGAHYAYAYPGEYTSTASEYNLLITAQADKLVRADNADLDSTAWKTTGNDPHSTFATTAQIAPSDLFTDRFTQLEIAPAAEHYVAGKGDDLPVTTDKKYQARNDLTPSLGAYEYAVLTITSYNGADTATVNVAENQTLAATVTADNGNASASITYSLLDYGDGAYFTINSATGELSFVNAPDFEAPGDSDGDNVYVVTVQAADGTYTDVQTMTVTVTDVYEAPPPGITLFKEDFGTPYDPYPGVYDFPSGWTRANVDNLTPAPGIEVISQAWMAIEDPENQGTNICAFSNSYYESGGAADDWMWTPAIDLSGSNIQLNWKARTYSSTDNKCSYEVRIMTTAPTGGTGNMGNMLSSTVLSGIAAEDYTWVAHTADLSAYSGQKVYIGFRNNSTVRNLLMVDDVIVKTNFAITSTHTDTLFRNTDAISVAENTTAVGTVAATNEAGGTISYSITGGADAAQFSIDINTGVLSFVTAPDFEAPGDAGANNVYEMTVQATNGTLTDVQTIAVTVTDVYEATPANITLFQEDFDNIPGPTTGGSSPSAFPAGWTLVDVDQMTPSQYIFDLFPNAWNRLSKRSFYPDDPEADTCVWATSWFDYGSNDPADDWMWTPAIDLSGSSIQLSWKAKGYGTYEVRIMTTTPTGSTGNMGNMLSSAVLFSEGIQNFAGVVHSADLSAYSGQKVYISFRHTTGAGDGVLGIDDVTVKTNFAITSTHTDTLFRNTDTINVAENATAVGTVAATNEAGGTVSYSITGGADAAKFTINSSTGVLSFITAPDFEAPGDAGANNVYEVTVQATNGTLTDVQTIAVTITDVADAAVLTITSYSGAPSATVNVAENQTLVTTVTATYSDPAGVIAFSLVGHDDDSYFTVNSTTGQLSFVNAPDFERPSDPDENNMYMVTVQASVGSVTAVQRFKVRVTNVNDNAPEFGSFDGDASVTLSIPENTTAIGTVWAVDKEPGTTITYSVLSNNEGTLFSINATTGVLRFITAPDYENPRDQYAGNVYIVTVQASDGQLTSLQRFKIKVKDVNEGAGRMSNSDKNTAQVDGETENGSKGISVFPNPVTGKRFTLRTNGLAEGQYILELYTANGQLAYRQTLNHTGKSTSYPIQLPATLTKGIYMLKLAGAGMMHSEKLLID